MRWVGLWPAAESDNFGLYETQTWEWDALAYAAPYHLAFKSAGNNRNDNAPTNGQAFTYYDSGWKTGVYDSAIHPLEDGWDNGGYDTVTPKGLRQEHHDSRLGEGCGNRDVTGSEQGNHEHLQRMGTHG